jgi:hypothetical protein
LRVQLSSNQVSWNQLSASRASRKQFSLFFLFLYQRFIVVKQVAVYARQFQRLGANHFVLGSAFFTGDHIALFNFIEFNV